MKEKILEEYSNGLAIYKIAELNNTSGYFIRKILTENDITIRQNSINSRRYPLNEHKFDEIDSEEKAYWLGFLYADGCVQTKLNDISLALSVEDIGHLEKFRIFLETDKPVKIYPKKDGNDYCRLIATSPIMKKSLIEKGCVPRKTEILVFPEIREDLVFHFIRGYFDGDGSLSYVSTTKEYKFRICGTYEFLSSVKEILDIKNSLTQRWPERGVNNWDIDIGGNVQVYRKAKLLYENASIFLDRKYERFCQLRSRHIERYGSEPCEFRGSPTR